jgi:hypothetical protein
VSDNEKDRLGAKLHDLEKAREDLYFAEQERAQIAKLRARDEAVLGAARCPSCGAGLSPIEPSTELVATYCPNGHGAWVRIRDLATLAEKAGLAELVHRLDRLGRT